MLKPLRCLILACLALMAQAVGAWAQDKSNADLVTLGLYVNQLEEMSLRDGRIGVDFYLWTRWRNPEIDPLQGIELMNGRIEQIDVQEKKQVGEELYALARVRAVINATWDVARFPLDRQQVRIVLEDTTRDASRLIYQPDVRNSELAPDLAVPGYRIASGAAHAATHVYRTNYGDTSMPTGKESQYSRFTYTIELARPGLTYFFKLYTAIFISTMVAFLAFLVKPTDLDPRFGLGVGAVFAVVACAFVISSQLPETAEFALTDQINVVSMGLIFLSIVQSAISLALYEAAPAMSRRFDWSCTLLFPVVYALAILALMVGVGI